MSESDANPQFTWMGQKGNLWLLSNESYLITHLFNLGFARPGQGHVPYFKASSNKSYIETFM